jgi:hypothetical protein
MTLDPKERKQLRAAREQIARQLMQLEGVAADPYNQVGLGPDNRAIYAQLQKELREINDLLGDDGGERSSERPDTAGAYYPLSADFSEGRQTKPNGIAIGMVAFAIMWLLFVFVRTLIAR